MRHRQKNAVPAVDAIVRKNIVAVPDIMCTLGAEAIVLLLRSSFVVSCSSPEKYRTIAATNCLPDWVGADFSGLVNK